jgi:hypothetical protein
VSDADAPAERLLDQGLFEVSEFADGTDDVDAPGFMNGHAGGIIPTVF